MKYSGKNSVSFFMEILLFVIMISTAAVVVFLPKIIDFYLKTMYNMQPTLSMAKMTLLIVLYPCALAAFVVENELRKIFKSLVKEDPFVQRNVRALNIMGISMLIILAMFVVKIVLMNTLMTMVLCLGCGILAIFCFVLADVFKQAITYKQDNDLTI